MVGGSDHDGVHVAVVQEAAEVLVALRLFLAGVGYGALGLFDGAAVHVTDAVDVAVGGVSERLG